MRLNDFRDMVVVTGEIGRAEAKEAYCAGYAANSTLYAIERPEGVDA